MFRAPILRNAFQGGKEARHPDRRNRCDHGPLDASWAYQHRLDYSLQRHPLPCSRWPRNLVHHAYCAAHLASHHIARTTQMGTIPPRKGRHVYQHYRSGLSHLYQRFLVIPSLPARHSTKHELRVSRAGRDAPVWTRVLAAQGEQEVLGSFERDRGCGSGEWF